MKEKYDINTARQTVRQCNLEVDSRTSLAPSSWCYCSIVSMLAACCHLHVASGCNPRHTFSSHYADTDDWSSVS